MVDYDSLPICEDCDGRYDPRDAGWLFAATCCGACEINRIDALLLRLVTARSKPARRKALKAIKRLAAIH